MQGSPVWVSSDDCTTYFTWYSTAACKNAPSVVAEIPCYSFDGNGKKYDLMPLIRKSGGYLINELVAEEGDFYINVCREIIAGSYNNLQLLNMVF